jgi:hypothetical protein
MLHWGQPATRGLDVATIQPAELVCVAGLGRSQLGPRQLVPRQSARRAQALLRQGEAGATGVGPRRPFALAR